jgi:hypothetical protein
MERPVTEAMTSPQSAETAAIHARVGAYWRELGLTDPVLIESLTQDAIQRARRLMGRPDERDLLSRALEIVQRRFDHALANAMGIPPSNDPHPLAAARAALLFSPHLAADTLFRHDETTRELAEQLKVATPVSIPPESPLGMNPVPIDFWLFQSTDRSSK